MTDRVEISKKLVMINSASSLITRMISISVLVWLQQYLLKRITPEEYSLLPVLYSVMMFAPLITTILTSGLGRYIVEAYAKGDDKRVTQIVSTMFPILCAAGVVFLAGGWTFAWHIDKILNIAPERLWDARIMMALLMFNVAIGLPLSPFTCGFFVRQKFVLQNLIGVGSELFRLAILFTLIFGVSTRVLWVVTASVCAGILGQTINLIISRRLVPILRFRPSHICWSIAKELTSFGGWGFVASAADTIRTSADVIILNKFATPLDVTCFHLGSLPMRQIQGTIIAARGPLQPVLTAMHAKNRQDSLRKTYVQGGRFGVWVAAFLCLPLIVYAPELVILYLGEVRGAEYIEATTVIRLLLPILIVAYPAMLLPAIANAKGDMRSWALRTIVMHGGNLVLTYIFVGMMEMGATGSALATCIAMCAGYPLLFWTLGLRMLDLSPKSWLVDSVLPSIYPGIVATAVWVAMVSQIRPTSWLVVVIEVAAGMIVYVLVLYFIALRGEDRVYMRGATDKLRKGVSRVTAPWFS